jgi:acetoin utilization protein AcuB
MFVADWMTKQVITVGPDESVSHAMRLMKDRGIKHLPVVGPHGVLGVISDRDIRAYTPSKATALDVYEINYLLAKATVKDAMGPQLKTTAPDSPVEEAALLLLEGDIGCLPVLAEGQLVGIISDRDIFRALVDITGVRHGGHRICVTVTDAPGSIRVVADTVRKHGFHLHGMLTSYEGVPQGQRRVVIRTDTDGDFEALSAELQRTHTFVRMTKG